MTDDTGDSDAVTVDELEYVTAVENIDHGERVLVEIRGREIAVFNVNGEFHALANYCVHQGGPVCEGALSGTLTQSGEEVTYVREGEIVSCPWHGWEFDIKSGEHLARDKYKVPTYDVVVHRGELYLDL